ncbi:CDP-alcohol phosphatidyltransferase family protein [bacterium]|nr:CDP-alcohol phosphatidyltransferase family protein [bacterium]
MHQTKRIWTVPNGMTFMRLVFLFPILWCLMHQLRSYAFLLAILSILTDLTDGWVARKLNQTSDLGRIMDPVVDKINIMAVAFFLAISPHYDLPLWYFTVIAGREILIMAGGWIVIRRKKTVPESNRPGKWSAFVSGLMIACFIIGWQPWAWILLWISLSLTAVSTCVYAAVLFRTLRPER